jgi:hypothetical protein
MRIEVYLGSTVSLLKDFVIVLQYYYSRKCNYYLN